MSDEQDAKRYRWLRDACRHMDIQEGLYWMPAVKQPLDEFIDSQIACNGDGTSRVPVSDGERSE